MDIVDRLNRAIAHPHEEDDGSGLLAAAVEEIVMLRFQTAPRTEVPNPNARQFERGSDGQTYPKQGAGNTAAVMDSNTRKSASKGLSADDPL
jgi:hypothetical protein